MSDAKGTFTVWYLPKRSKAEDRYKHGITASSRDDLKQQAEEHCPKGYFIKSINWQRGGTTNIWYKLQNKPFKEGWDEKVCKRAFRE